MVWLFLALAVCVVLASAVIVAVMVPARRQGRPLLTERGEHLMTSVAETTDKVGTRARTAGENVKRRTVEKKAVGERTRHVQAEKSKADAAA